MSPLRGKLLIALFVLILGSVPGWSHPLDEWFVNFEVDQTLVGHLRVPFDQVERLKGTPIQVSVKGKEVAVRLEMQGTEESGRALIKLTADLPADVEELRIQVPQGLLDENQSLVGFLSFSGAHPTTLLIPPGGEKSFQTHKTKLSAWQFFKLGGQHIVIGYDHLLFLFCLLIPGGTLRHFALVLTAFTLGHSTTLAASVLGYLSVPSHLVEATIALSIVLAAAMNFRSLDTPDDEGQLSSKSRVLMAGGFGLVHGLGFAGILLDIGVRAGQVFAPLVGFNLGIEAGQMVIAACCYPFILAAHRSSKRRVFLITASCLAIAFGAIWFFERIAS